MPKPSQKSNKKLYKRIVIVAVATPLTLVVLFILFASQVPQYSYNYVKCGFRQPVKIENNGGRNTYVTPGESGYEDAVLFVVGYYCTEQEAINAGHERTNKPI